MTFTMPTNVYLGGAVCEPGREGRHVDMLDHYGLDRLPEIEDPGRLLLKLTQGGGLPGELAS